jgi:hypothetical protein
MTGAFMDPFLMRKTTQVIRHDFIPRIECGQLLFVKMSVTTPPMNKNDSLPLASFFII